MKMNFTIATTAVSLLAVMLLVMSCEKTVPPKVAMVEASIAVSYNKAWMVAECDHSGSLTALMDEIPDTLLCPEIGTPFSVELSDLSPSTVYICTAFARNERGRGYSNAFQFTTMNSIDTIPLVDTYTIKEITYCSAVPSGQVLSGGGQEVMEKGICYGTEPKPTVEGVHVALGMGEGPFECQLTDLLPDTRYYVCAYAVCTQGVYYGNQLDFYTKVPPMAVRTISVSDVTASRVKAEGEVIRDGGYEVTECGFCWGMEHGPTIEGLHIKASIGMGAYSCYFSGLEKGQTHYVRAYAINEEGVAYGDEIEFVPDDPFTPWFGGASPGLFSVSEDRQVRFSQGNLQYYPDNNIWRFAEKQWDFVGGSWDSRYGMIDAGTVYSNEIKCDNTLISRYYAGWIDLFGWGTSGWDNGNIYYRASDHAAHIFENAYYGPLGNFDLTGEYAHADWGIHNTISNGGSRQWRIPTAEEINYLLMERETPSGMRFVMAVVAGVPGLVVLPDDWNESIYPLKGTNSIVYYSINIIPGGKWLDVLEPAGAVFLPAGGLRYQFGDYNGSWYDWYDRLSSLLTVGVSLQNWYVWYNTEESTPLYISGSYWTSTQCGVSNAFAMRIGYHDSYLEGFIEPADRCMGCSVRLVSDE